MIIRCFNCGAQVDEEAATCPSCRSDFSIPKRSAPGKAPAPPPPMRPDASPPPAARPPSPSQTWLPPRGPGTLKGIFGGIAALGGVGILLAYFAFRPETPAGGRGERPPFPKDSRGLTQALSAVKGMLREPDQRDPGQIQRVAIDPFHPELGAVKVSPETALVPAPGENRAEAPASPRSLRGLGAPPPPEASALPSGKRGIQAAAGATQASPRADAGNLWVFEGMAYDLISLGPVVGLKMIFTDPSGNILTEIATNNQGSYRVALWALSNGGYHLSAGHPDYLEKYLDELTPPFRQISKQRRLFLAGSAAAKRPWIGSTFGPTRRDIFMIPKTPQQ